MFALFPIRHLLTQAAASLLLVATAAPAMADPMASPEASPAA